MNLLFMGVYGIGFGTGSIFLILSIFRGQWERVTVLAIAVPFLFIGFMSNYWAECWPETFSQMLNLSF